MKKILLLTTISMFLISCGGGGWSEDDRNMAMSECEGTSEQCDCMINKMEKKFDSYSAMMNFDQKATEDEVMEMFGFLLEAAEDCGVDLDDF